MLIHPESLVHALVGFCDGGLIAHVGPPDMRHAIGHALYWPERRALPVERLDLAAAGQLTFRAPDTARYPALRLAREVMARAGACRGAFNAAKERALDHFIAGHIGFPSYVGRGGRGACPAVVRRPPQSAGLTLEDVFEADRRRGPAPTRWSRKEQARSTVDPISLIPAVRRRLHDVLAFVVALSVIVAIHEYGHYIVGRWCGIKADVFSLGFGPVIWARTDRRGTRWQIAALPFGGYVKFMGDQRRQRHARPNRGRDARPEAPHDAGRAALGAAATVAAGPVFNFVLSVLVFAGVMMAQGGWPSR